eukprot:COSAG05_NODE_5187_length_1242_cov_5.006999_2_plen_64_part_00
MADAKGQPSSSVREQLDPRLVWKLNPAVGEGLEATAPWLAQAWGRWLETQQHSWADLVAAGEV